MSVRCFEILTGRGLRRDRSSQGNHIPSGRQLPRTPPMMDVKKHLDFSCDLSVACEEPRRVTGAGGRDRDDHAQSRRFDISTPPTKGNSADPDEPSSMLKGMKGYQLTAGDLEFIKRLQEEKLIKKYQEDLENVKRLLKKETMALEMEHASRKKAQVELGKFQSCEELTQWVKVVLQVAAPSTDLTDLDTKSLLATVTAESARTAIDEKKLQLARLENMVADKRKKEAELRGQQEKQIANEQLKIQGLMSKLLDLTSELAQQEEIYQSLQMQIKKQEETGADAEKEDSSEEVQAKGQVQLGRKDKKGGKSAEKVRDAPKQNKVKSTRNKRTDAQNVEDDDHLVGTSEKLTTREMKAKSEAATLKTTKPVKASRGSQKKVEDQESSSVPVNRGARGGRKPPGATQAVASQPEDRRKAKSKDAAPERSRGEAAAAPAEEAEGAGLRRSRRIASRR